VRAGTTQAGDATTLRLLRRQERALVRTQYERIFKNRIFGQRIFSAKICKYILFFCRVYADVHLYEYALISMNVYMHSYYMSTSKRLRCMYNFKTKQNLITSCTCLTKHQPNVIRSENHRRQQRISYPCRTT
jgi:hypothetical protein